MVARGAAGTWREGGGGLGSGEQCCGGWGASQPHREGRKKVQPPAREGQAAVRRPVCCLAPSPCHGSIPETRLQTRQGAPPPPPPPALWRCHRRFDPLLPHPHSFRFHSRGDASAHEWRPDPVGGSAVQWARVREAISKSGEARRGGCSSARVTRCSLCEVHLSRPRLVGGAGRALPAGGGFTTLQLGRSDPGGPVFRGGNKVVMEVVSGESGELR